MKEFDYLGANGKRYDFFFGDDRDGIVMVDTQSLGLAQHKPLPVPDYIHVEYCPDPSVTITTFNAHTNAHASLDELLDKNRGKDGKKPDTISEAQRVLEAERKGCIAVFIAVASEPVCGKPLLPRDEDYGKAHYTAVVPNPEKYPGVDGLSDKVRSELMKNCVGIAYAFKDDLQAKNRIHRFRSDPLRKKEDFYYILCRAFDLSAYHNIPIRTYYPNRLPRFCLDLETNGRGKEDDWAKVSLWGKDLNQCFIGSYNSLKEMVLANWNNPELSEAQRYLIKEAAVNANGIVHALSTYGPDVDIQAPDMEVNDPILKAKIAHSNAQQMVMQPAAPVQKNRSNDIER